MKKKIDKIDVYYWIVVVVIFVLLACVGMRSCHMGKDPKHYTTICIDGHVYQMINFGTKIALASKLNDDGRPILCQ